MERLQKLEEEFVAREKRQANFKNKDKVVELAIFYDHAIYERTKQPNDAGNNEILKYLLASINGVK